jgi:hypothetical protein
VELARLMRESQLDFIKGAMAMRGWMRDHFLRVARSEAVPPRILEQMREMVRADIAQQRLRDKGLGFHANKPAMMSRGRTALSRRPARQLGRFVLTLPN